MTNVAKEAEERRAESGMQAELYALQKQASEESERERERRKQNDAKSLQQIPINVCLVQLEVEC